MTRKDYWKFAEMFFNLKTIIAEDEYMSTLDRGIFHAKLYMWRLFVHTVADIFQEDNPRFNRERFYEACGLEE